MYNLLKSLQKEDPERYGKTSLETLAKWITEKGKVSPIYPRETLETGIVGAYSSLTLEI